MEESVSGPPLEDIWAYRLARVDVCRMVKDSVQLNDI